MSEQTPSTGRTVHYLDDGTPYLVVKDDDIEGVLSLEARVDLAEGAPAYDGGNIYKDMWHWPERV